MLYNDSQPLEERDSCYDVVQNCGVPVPIVRTLGCRDRSSRCPLPPAGPLRRRLGSRLRVSTVGLCRSDTVLVEECCFVHSRPFELTKLTAAKRCLDCGVVQALARPVGHGSQRTSLILSLMIVDPC